MNLSWFGRLSTALVVAASVALTSGCGGGSPSDNPSPDKDKTDKDNKPAGAGTPFKMSAVDLSREFVNGLEAADRKYASKWIEVEGEVQSTVQLPGARVLTVYLVGFKKEGDPDPHTVGAWFTTTSPFYDKAKKLKEKDKVKIKGEYLNATGANVLLDKGELVEPK
jgi:hypothetical protein